MSAITALGTPAEVYAYGTQYVTTVLCYPLVMASTAYLFLPVFYNLDVATSYEASTKSQKPAWNVSFQYLEWRFDESVRMLATFLFISFMLLYNATVIYAPALAISQS